MKKYVSLIITLVAVAATSIFGGVESTLSVFGNLPLSFEPNTGQIDHNWRFMAHASGGTLYFASSEIALSVNRPHVPRKSGVQAAATDVACTENGDSGIPPHMMHLRFVGGNSATAITAGKMLPGKVNYFAGNDSHKWRTNLPTHSSITYEGLYHGIDLSYDGIGGQLEGTYTVAARADASRIRWRYEGAEKVYLDDAGNLHIQSPDVGSRRGRELVERAPLAWQAIGRNRVPVGARYAIAADGSISFRLGSHDRTHALTIDPVLTYSTYLGVGGDEPAYNIGVDAEKNIYVSGLYNPTNVSNGYDVFVVKLNPSGSAILYNTIFGGSVNDLVASGGGTGMAVDATGNVYVTGVTYSTNFPTLNAFQPNYGGGTGDIFVTKLNSSGSLVYSTYLGGGNGDSGFGITVDKPGNAYVTGYTLSSNFPLAGAFQSNYGGGATDAFVSKLSADGSTLIYSTYLGGSDFDQAYGIAVDAAGNAYIAGVTASLNFPVANAYQSLIGGNRDVFVTKLNPSGSALVYSTYIGGILDEQSNAMTIDSSGNVYLTGRTQSANFPTVNPYQLVIGSTTDTFVTKLRADGAALVYSTFLGGVGTDYGYGIAVDAAGNAYVTGQTGSSNFPTANPIQASLNGSTDAFLTKLNAAGNALVYSTYLGGSSGEGGLGVAPDGVGNVYVTGFTRSTNYPTVNPIQSQYGGGPSDAFITKITELPALIGVVSRKTHGSAGMFDIDLPLTGPRGIECRSGGTNKVYTLVFTFGNLLASVGGASVTDGTGTISSSAIDSNDAHQYVVNLTGVTNAQIITLSLSNVTDSAGNSSSAVSASMGVLLGDTTANGAVNSSDISDTKAQSGTAATSSNFREDVTVSGLINSADISLVKSKSGTALP